MKLINKLTNKQIDKQNKTEFIFNQFKCRKAAKFLMKLLYCVGGEVQQANLVLSTELMM